MDADGWTDGRAVRKAVFSMIATKRMSTLVGLSPTTQSLGHNIQQYKEESEKEHMDEVRSLSSPFLRSARRIQRARKQQPSPPHQHRGKKLTVGICRTQDLDVVHYAHSDDSSDELKRQDDLAKDKEDPAAELVRGMNKLAV